MHPIRQALTAALALALAGPAAGHDLWIEPAPGPVAVGGLLAVDLRVGHGGEAESLPRNGARLLRLQALAPGAAPVDAVDLPGLDGARPYGVLRAGAAGTWILAYEGRAAHHRLEADAFEAYLREEGLDHALDARRRAGHVDRPGLELFSRSLKALVVVGDGGTPLDRPVGLPVELVLEGLSEDGLATVRMEVGGRPHTGALVDARRTGASEPEAAGRTDADGRVRLRLEPGPWVLATVHMVAEPAAGADWRTTFATTSLTVADIDADAR